MGEMTVACRILVVCSVLYVQQDLRYEISSYVSTNLNRIRDIFALNIIINHLLTNTVI
jgi:hypothetical protein